MKPYVAELHVGATRSESTADEKVRVLQYKAEEEAFKSLRSRHIMSVFSAVAYGVVGLLMSFVNKAVLLKWPFPNSFLFLQMVASIALVYTIEALGGAKPQPVQLRAARALLPVVFFYNSNVAFALAAVKNLSIPVYHVLKRLTPVMVLGTKYMIGGPLPSSEVILSVLTVVSGCVLAGLGDLSFDMSGYAAALASCVLQTTYLILVERSGTEKGFSSMQLLLYNGILSLPVLLLLIILTGEIRESFAGIVTYSKDSVLFLLLLLAALLMGALLNYCLFLCTLCNSALTTTIVGTLRSVMSTVLGFFLFGGVKFTGFIVLGVFFNTFGGVWYTIIKYKQRRMDAKCMESSKGG